MWPHDTFATKNGGHTYLGFFTEREPSLFQKGIVKPIPSGNFELLTEEDQEAFHKGFAEKGYRLVVGQEAS